MDNKILGVEDLSVALNTSFPMGGRFALDSLSLIKPYLLFEMKDSSNNFIGLLPVSQPDTIVKSQVSTDTLSKPLIYSVNSFIIRDGIIDFTDKSLKEPFKYHLSQLELKVDSISSSSVWLKAYSSIAK
jgi:hypothetical protein